MSTSIAPRVTFARVVRAEWVKTGTVRSTYWTAALALAFTLLFAAGILYLVLLAPAADVPDPAALVTENYGATPSVGVLGLAFMFAYALVAILGVLAVSPERATGLLATTLAAVPRRTPVYVAKLLVSASIGVGVALVVGTASVLIAQPALAGLGLDSSFFDPRCSSRSRAAQCSSASSPSCRRRSPRCSAAPRRRWAPCSGLLVLAPALVPIIPGIGCEPRRRRCRAPRV